MIYNNRLLGEVAIFKNLVFNNGIADHASLKGRPCLILADLEDKFYIIPLSHSKDKFIDKEYYYEIPKDKLIKNPYKPFDTRTQFFNFTGILEMDVFGINPICNISEKEYYKIIKQLLMLDFHAYPKVYERVEKIRDDLTKQEVILEKKLKKK